MMEPDYIAQTGEPVTPQERMDWVRKCVEEAHDKGCVFGRASVHPSISNLILYEGWKVVPEDQGEPCFQLVPIMLLSDP